MVATALHEADVIPTDEALAQAVRRIFSANTGRGSGQLDSRTLYRLWQSTGLRRNDLTAGIRALIDAGSLRAEHRSGLWRYQLIRRSQKSASDVEATMPRLPSAERKSPSTAKTLRDPASTRAGFGKRTEDQDNPATSAERRRTPQNFLLSALPGREREQLKLQLELVPMPQGMVLWEKGQQVHHLYFPIDCVLSVSQQLQNSESSEIATVGNEGMMDAVILLDGDTAERRAQVWLPGYSYRLPVDSLRLAFGASGAVQHDFLRYVRVLILQLSQLTACSRHHTVEQQLCRVILTSIDRIQSSTLHTTHEALASILGRQCEAVVEAIDRLSTAALLRSEPGRLLVLDREELQQRSCECYAAIASDYAQLRTGKRLGSLFNPSKKQKSR